MLSYLILHILNTGTQKEKKIDPRYSRIWASACYKSGLCFLLHDLYHLRPNGIMTIVLPHGVLFRGG